LELARTWLRTCQKTHEACRTRATNGPTSLPSRLIKVRALEGSVTHLNLVPQDDLPLGTKYLTLSHCWGGADIVKLTEATLSPFQISINPIGLPKSFLDSFQITVSLGYEFIWIDSLCIIQDSRMDWECEAARMASIYQQSVCTIAAVGSENSHGGCFKSRSTLCFTSCQLADATSERSGVYVGNYRLPRQPLHKRAWVLQERALSIRTLNFGSEMLERDCVSAQASEWEPEMLKPDIRSGVKCIFYELCQQRSILWWELIREYSSCELSFHSDKWPAIQGLATEVEKKLGYKLHFGLWAHRLVDELLWTTTFPKEERMNIDAPSWSWLSIDGQVY
ncbi:HET-domain-containing protein, partial [Lentithecium fluviatile CBS 122367]